MKNSKKLQIEVLVDFGCTYIEIDEQLVKDKRIQIRPINFSFGVYNADGTKNGDITRVAPLEVEINRHKKHIKIAVMDLNGMDMFLEHDWLVKHNPEVNWKEDKIGFTRYPESCMLWQLLVTKTNDYIVSKSLK